MFRSFALWAFGAAFTFALAAPGDAQDAGFTVQGSDQVIEVEASQAVTLRFDVAYSELSMGDPEIADLASLSDTQVYVLGKTVGKTTMTVIRDGGDLETSSYTIVVYRDIAPLVAFLSEAASSVTLARDGDVVTVTGCVDGERAGSAAESVISELSDWGYVTLADIGACQGL